MADSAWHTLYKASIEILFVNTAAARSDTTGAVPVPLHPGLSYPSDTRRRYWLYTWRWKWAGSSAISVTTHCTKHNHCHVCQVYAQKPYVRTRRNFCYNVAVTFVQNIVVAILNMPDSQREQWSVNSDLRLYIWNVFPRYLRPGVGVEFREEFIVSYVCYKCLNLNG